MNSYLFIDGAYLREHFEKQMQSFYGEVPSIQYEVLASRLSGHRTYYYDAIRYTRGESESDAECKARIERMQALHDHISSQPGYHVREGHVRKSPQKKKQEQKGVDVQLAVEALEHAARGNMQLAVLLTGDLDFEPLLLSLARMGVRTRLIYVPQHAAQELRNAADEIQKVTLEHFFDWSAGSFRQNRKQVKLQYRQNAPEPPIFEPYKEGVWKSRKVVVYKTINQAPARLHVEWGDELSEPSYTMEYWDVDKLSDAFEITFGKVEWKAALTSPAGG